MTVGALIFAQNTTGVDYVKIATFAAKRVKEYLGIPVSIVTDSKNWLLSSQPDHPFEHIIDVLSNDSDSIKNFYDGSMSSKKLPWKNRSRFKVYEVTPYDKTLVIDSDYILGSDVLKIALERECDLQIYRKSFDLAGWRNTKEFERVNCYSIPFYWATTFVFDKNPVTEAFFDLVSYIKENWLYFRVLYNIEDMAFRNDYAFSIAIHIMNGKVNGGFAVDLPGSMSYILDRDLLVDIKGSDMQFLVEKENFFGEYTMAKTSGIDVHIMNKASLARYIDGGTGV